MEWKYSPGDMVRLHDGRVYGIAARERTSERGRVVPVYEAMPVRDGRLHGSVRLIRDAGIAGRFEHKDDAYP